jgi:hypothetical protein
MKNVIKFMGVFVFGVIIGISAATLLWVANLFVVW